jgi:hypothetical protein
MGANHAGRDQSFVQVRSHLIYYLLVLILEYQFDLLVDIHPCKPKQPPIFESRCFYGQLHHILVCELPADPLFEARPVRHLFAAVQRCDTDGLDVTKESVTYTMMRPQSEMIDLTAL